jgi:hypothetical protein
MVRSSSARGPPDRFTALLVVTQGLAQAAKSFSRRFKERLCFGITDTSNIVPAFLPGLLKHLLDALRMLLWGSTVLHCLASNHSFLLALRSSRVFSSQARTERCSHRLPSSFPMMHLVSRAFPRSKAQSPRFGTTTQLMHLASISIRRKRHEGVMSIVMPTRCATRLWESFSLSHPVKNSQSWSLPV